METITIKENKDEKGHKMINQYVLLETIGHGTYGKVKLAIKVSEDGAE